MPRFLIATGAVSAAPVRCPGGLCRPWPQGPPADRHPGRLPDRRPIPVLPLPGPDPGGHPDPTLQGILPAAGGRPSHGGRYLAILRKPLCHQHDRHPHTGHHHPIGGVAFIAAWLMLAIGIWRN